MVKLELLAAPSSVPWGVVVFAGAFLAQTLSVTVGTVEGAGEIVWLPGGCLLVALMRLPQSRWVACCAGAWVGVLITQAWIEVPMPAYELKTLVSLLLVTVGAWATLQICADATRVRDFRWALTFLAVFGALIPALSATLWTFMAPSADAVAHRPANWLHVALCHSLGFMLLAPLWLRTLPREAFGPHYVHWRSFGVGAIATAAVALLWIAFGPFEHSRLLLILAPILAIAIAALVGGATAVYTFVVAATIIAVLLTMRGSGPFVEENAVVGLLYIKSWAYAIAILGWLLVLLIEQQSDMQVRLDDGTRQVREMAGRLFEAQEQERSRIARDLHDDVNQRLALVSIELSSLRRHAVESERAELDHIQDELIALSEDVRDISHNLHPSMLQETGLSAALGALCSAQRHRNGPSIDVHVADDADNLPALAALCIYRATQEALGNAIRHARAHHIEVRLRTVPPQAELTITDDGVGFDANAAATRRRGLGLFSLEERAKLLGGNFELTTAQGNGTRICIRIPLPH